MSATRSRTRPPFDLSLREGDELVELTRRGHYLLLSDAGLYLGRNQGSQRARFIPWELVTHLAVGARSLWLGTTTSVRLILRGRRTPVSLIDVGRKIEQRIARLPGGIQQLSRMREIDQRMRNARLPLVSLSVVAVCVAVHLLQISDVFVSEVGTFVRELVGEGELWRVVTPHFLHDDTWFFASPEALVGTPLLLRVPSHIAFNCTLALLLGNLVEQPLGRARTVFVLTLSGLGAILLTGIASSSPVLGASGMVMGLAGAVLALEISVPERLPASWRIPRWLLIGVLLLEMVHSVRSEYVAGWAHLGGFLSGYLAARLVARDAFREPQTTLWPGPAAAVIGVWVAISFAAAAPLVLRMGWAFDRHAVNLLALDEVSANALNNLAWRFATETDGFPENASRALDLARRAVSETERENPDYLDTLAEVQFLAGDPDAAIQTIEEAIEIAPWDAYFREQRDRFIGLREDRPESPNLPWYRRGPTEPPTWDNGTGIEI